MLFHEALKRIVEDGAVVTREGWNGKGMSVFLTDLTIIDQSQQMFVIESDSGLLSPWVPSTGDLLAADWSVR